MLIDTMFVSDMYQVYEINDDCYRIYHYLNIYLLLTLSLFISFSNLSYS